MTKEAKIMLKLEKESRVQITDVLSVQMSCYFEEDNQVNVIEVGNFDRFEISLKKAEALKLIEALQKFVKEL